MASLAIAVSLMWALALCLIVAGVWLLTGTAWSLIAAGVGLVISAGIIRAGMVVRGE